MRDATAENQYPQRPPWTMRIIALSYYVGCAPFSIRARDSFSAHHRAQALGIFLLLLMLLTCFAATVLALSYAMTFHRAAYEAWTLEARVLGLFRKLFLCWAVFWAFGGGMALLGGMRDMPVIARIARRQALLRGTAATLAATYALVATALLLGVHALGLLRSDAAPARAYCLVHDDGTFPRMLFALGVYPVARAAQAQWGPGQTQLLPLTRENFALALREGTFVFVGSHGIKQGLLIAGGALRPEDLREMPRGGDLAYVYLAGCDSGAERAGWVNALAPAEVQTFERLTSVLEHTWWLWFEGPGVIRRLPGSQGSGGAR